MATNFLYKWTDKLHAGRRNSKNSPEHNDILAVMNKQRSLISRIKKEGLVYGD